MEIDSNGNIVGTYDYIVDCIKSWMEIDRNDVYGYSFFNYYVDFSSLDSIRAAISEIIEILSLECSITNIKRNLSRVVVNLEYAGTSFELEI